MEERREMKERWRRKESGKTKRGEGEGGKNRRRWSKGMRQRHDEKMMKRRTCGDGKE